MPDGDRSRWANRRAPDLDPWREQDACGVGFVARASGERGPDILTLALQALARVAHRGAASTDSSGDGAGVLTQTPSRLFYSARATRPTIRQGIVAAPADAGRTDAAAWERALYLARRTIERRIAEAEPAVQPFFVCSLSCRTLVYKALLTGPQLPAFFPDLK